MELVNGGGALVNKLDEVFALGLGGRLGERTFIVTKVASVALGGSAGGRRGGTTGGAVAVVFAILVPPPPPKGLLGLGRELEVLRRTPPGAIAAATPPPAVSEPPSLPCPSARVAEDGTGGRGDV